VICHFVQVELVEEKLRRKKRKTNITERIASKDAGREWRDLLRRRIWMGPPPGRAPIETQRKKEGEAAAASHVQRRLVAGAKVPKKRKDKQDAAKRCGLVRLGESETISLRIQGGGRDPKEEKRDQLRKRGRL